MPGAAFRGKISQGFIESFDCAFTGSKGVYILSSINNIIFVGISLIGDCKSPYREHPAHLGQRACHPPDLAEVTLQLASRRELRCQWPGGDVA